MTAVIHDPAVVTVVQARRGSSRLPDKVLRPLAGEPLLARLVERVRAARRVGVVVVATTTAPADDAIEALCRVRNWPVYRGHTTDLLDRHFWAALMYGAEAVVKIPSDCPLISPRVIDKVLSAYLDDPRRWDYVSNLHPPTYPDGNDVEVMSFAALEKAWRQSVLPFEREHTTPFLWDNPERFMCHNVVWETGRNYSMTHRWTIDYEDDYRFVKSVYDELHPRSPLFELEEILDLLERRPELHRINARYAGVNWYRHHLGELKTIAACDTQFVEGGEKACP